MLSVPRGIRISSPRVQEATRIPIQSISIPAATSLTEPLPENVLTGEDVVAGKVAVTGENMVT
jgi:hypothetical protein